MPWGNAKRLAHHVEPLILDHHLLRCEEGRAWLQRLSSETGRQVICAADFVGQLRCLLEAQHWASLTIYSSPACVVWLMPPIPPGDE